LAVEEIVVQLRLQRSQSSKGSQAIFCIDVRAYLTPDETANLTKYGLGSITLYNSEAAQRQVDKANRHMAEGSVTSNLKAIGTYLLASLHLRVTVGSLVRGQHIECKTLDEMLGAEDAIVEACQRLKQYLNTAATFDGREVLFDFSGNDAEPKILAPGENILQLAPPQSAPATSSAAFAPMNAPGTSDSYEAEPNEFVEKLKYFWGGLTTGQKVVVSIVGLIVLWVVLRILGL